MGKIVMYPALASCVTGANGSADNQLKIPGVFVNIDGSIAPISGRWLRETQIWTDSGVDGDKLTNLRIEDVDAVLPPPLKQLLPNYPVIQYLTDQEVGLPAAGGIYIPPRVVIAIKPIDPIDSRGLQFIPSGLYLCSTFTAGDAAEGKICRINYVWGKYVETL